MLIPLTRTKFEDLIPLVATGAQYLYYWGKVSDFLQRLLISIVAVVALVLISGFFLGWEFGLLRFLTGLILGLYWLWNPVYRASLRNLEYRRYKYSGFWRGEVLDVFVSEELIGTEETVNNRGELVIVENRERRLNLEVGDESGYTTRLQVPLKRSHQSIRPGDTAEMLVLSNRDDLSRIAKVSDIFIPRPGVWVSDYPYLRRDAFEDVSRQLDQRSQRRSGSRRRPEFDDEGQEFSPRRRRPDDAGRSARRSSSDDYDYDYDAAPRRPSRDSYDRRDRPSSKRSKRRRSS